MLKRKNHRNNLMLAPWVNWLIAHNLKFVVYLLMFLLMPCYWLAYTEEALSDFDNDLEQVKRT